MKAHGCVLLTLLMAAAPASGQVATGRVGDEAGAAGIEGATVSLLSAARELIVGTVTGRDGRYTLRAPTAGDYIVVADHLGHRRLESPLASFRPAEPVTIDFELPLDPIELEGIRVEAERRSELRRRLAQYGVRLEELGRRFVPRTEIDRWQAATDFGPGSPVR